MTTKIYINFFKKNIMGRFGIPTVVVTDNGTLFADNNFCILMANLSNKRRFMSVKHLQTNGQAEAANRVILLGLKRLLDDTKGNWADELPHVLWAYQTTPYYSMGETHF